MSVYEASITNPKKQLEFYRDLSEQLQRENRQLNNTNIQLSTLNTNLRSTRDNYKSVLDEIREVINKMLYQGYIDGGTQYFATDDNSEFGVRAKVLLQILDKVKE